MKNSNRPILLVEDDDVDAMTVQRSLKELKVTNELIRRTDGEDALDYFRNPDNQEPCIILLDLNMPRMNGFEFLRIIKTDEQLRRIPVVVLTTSDNDEGIVESYDLSAAGYVVKPVDYAQFIEAMKILNMYWTLNRLPQGEQKLSSSSSSAK
jgi:CheY-like chemotaxis protein